jgi:Leucine-rich repeat (LRR) protein
MDNIVRILVFLSAVSVSLSSESCPIGCKCSTGRVWRNMLYFNNDMPLADCRNSNYTGIPRGLRTNVAALDMEGSLLLNGTLRNGAFASLGLYSLGIIVLMDCGITHIEEDAFLNMGQLFVLSLNSNRIETLNLKIFTWTTSLRNLWLSGNPLKTFSGMGYAIGSSFLSLGLEECQLTSIPEDIFSAMKQLHTLKLNGNRLAALSVNLFRPLINLKELLLHDNPWKCDCHLLPFRRWIGEGVWAWQLSQLECSLPASLANVTWNNLSPDNFTCEVSDEEGAPMMTTKTDLSSSQSCPIGCKCSTAKVWRDIWHFTNESHIADCRNSYFTGIPKGLRLDVEVLDMKSSSGLNGTLRDGAFSSLGLEIIVLEKCGIIHIEEYAFQNMDKLSDLGLERNLIETINLKIFLGTPNLRKLWLGGNPLKTFSATDYGIGSRFVRLGLDDCQLTDIPEGMFDVMKQLYILLLWGNKLTTLSVNVIRTFSNFKGVFLYNNPWKCDCHLRPLREWIGESDLAWQLNKLQCAEPVNLANVTWDNLSTSNFTCKVNDGEGVPMTTDTGLLPSSVEETVTQSTFPKSNRNGDKLHETADIPENVDHSTYLSERAFQDTQLGEQITSIDNESTHGLTVWIFLTLAFAIISVITITFLICIRRSSREFIVNKWRRLRNPTRDELPTALRTSLSLNSVSILSTFALRKSVSCYKQGYIRLYFLIPNQY